MPAGEYRAFLSKVRGAEQISKVGGYPFAPRWDGPDAVGAANCECHECGNLSRVLIQVADSQDTPVGGEGNLTLQLCTTLGCEESSVECSFERY